MSGRRLRRLPVLAHSQYLCLDGYEDYEDEYKEDEDKSLQNNHNEEDDSYDGSDKRQNGIANHNNIDIDSATAALVISDDGNDYNGNCDDNYDDDNGDDVDNTDTAIEIISWIEAMKKVVLEENNQHNLVKKGGSLTPLNK